MMNAQPIDDTTVTHDPHDDTFDRKAFVADSCISLTSCLFGPSRPDNTNASAGQETEEAIGFIEMINYVAQNPVVLWNGKQMVKLSPGEAAYKILTDPDCEITILRGRPGAEEPSPQTPP